MMIEIKVPTLPESVSDATIAKWYKKKGDFVARDDNLVDLETDKVMLEVLAPKNGLIEEIKVKEGEIVKTNQLLVLLKEVKGKIDEEFSPAVRRLVAEKEIDVAKIEGSGRNGRLTKKDVKDYLETQSEAQKEKSIKKEVTTGGARTERRVSLSHIRQRIAKRLVQVQHEAALLTTFNEINMKSVMDLREKYRNRFEKKFNVRLGFMSFFTKAAIEALKQFPMVNASIDGSDIIYHNYYDIGIAIGTKRGLVVPILRNAENMSMAEIEKQICEFASRAQEGHLTIDELTGGTFTITNGGTYGSLLSTPIINPPQTAILGTHKIVERPIAENGEIVVRPIMMVAVSYDHRVIDGREAILFLVTIKEILEDPVRMLLGF
ncbi:2-oxoglutarate dehydrogenase complex dihydrolipoyllysine-residue succinyltransferase [Coxiella endosymbiont of Amblyomma nuttalli]|uniref:2-oxoglutarate dehydrogenase complex dihydrolipoyllysine-residue succinyltransferase n=1 Tax=Coxiella endosymbiont of Amblyomma nuttalli TaxID=2749996 RepID=UPI001BA4DAC5|nr:2-oxoglutarate dehydrogenase complex dihydrolipoyllysine-residue succinyltransferase [Coxiella endosymbiont of Amblyomma nuttalli]QTS83695.1 Dihydrolipoyllysine-residue succinyltransferase component of 2-oxoglutarate dehydrogenase complex [Coxiella endosymbiont of Amblyomma nuttalli]